MSDDEVCEAGRRTYCLPGITVRVALPQLVLVCVCVCVLCVCLFDAGAFGSGVVVRTAAYASFGNDDLMWHCCLCSIVRRRRRSSSISRRHTRSSRGACALLLVSARMYSSWSCVCVLRRILVWSYRCCVCWRFVFACSRHALFVGLVWSVSCGCARTGGRLQTHHQTMHTRMCVGMVRSHSASRRRLDPKKLLASSPSWRSNTVEEPNFALSRLHALPRLMKARFMATCCASALLTNCWSFSKLKVQGTHR